MARVKWCIDTEDARRLNQAEQHERRRQCPRKRNKRQIARDAGLSYSASRRVIDRYKADRVADLAPYRRDHRMDEKRAAIRKTICGKRPKRRETVLASWSGTEPRLRS